MNKTHTAILLLIAAGSLVAADCHRPARARAQEGRSVDDELFDELDADPLDEQDAAPHGPGEKKGEAGASPDDELRRRLSQEPGAAATAEEDDPLLEIARRMRRVEGLMGRNDSSPATQNLQEKIVADLDRLLEQARRRSKQRKPGSSQPQQTASRRPIGQSQAKPAAGGEKPSDRPSTTSTQRPAGSGQTRRPDMTRMRKVMEELWGELPPRQRQQMLQMPVEEFLPKYELLIEEYFRRLAEEKGR